MRGSCAMRSRTDASNGFGVSEPLSVTDDDVGSARLQSNLPAFLKTARHPDERDDGGDADGNSRESQSGAQRDDARDRG